jgi:hypothetical protein
VTYGAGAPAGDLAGAIVGGLAAGVTIGGSIYASSTSGSSGEVVRSTTELGPVLIRGRLIGNTTNRVVISASGPANPVAANVVAIRSLTVFGRVERADILAGYIGTGALGGGFQIGAVTVGGDWIGSNLVAGAMAGPDGQFGTPDDVVSDPVPAGIVARIASVTIDGQVLGTVGGSDHFGFVSQQVGSFRVNGISLPLHPGLGNDLTGLPVGPTGDVTVREVA